MNKPAKAAAEVKVAPEPKASPRRAEEPPFAVHPGAIAAIVAATHGDPFSVLGPHRVGHDLYEIRAMLPERPRSARCPSRAATSSAS